MPEAGASVLLGAAARLDPPALTVVTGGSGWLGRALLHALTVADGPHARPGRIRALVRDHEDATLLADRPRVEPVAGDVTHASTLGALFDGASGAVDVIHTAGVIHPRRTDEFEDVNARGTANVLAAARRHGVRRFVHVSSNSPFGFNTHAADHFRNDEPYAPYLGYGRSKLRAELHVAAAVADGLDAVIVRPPWFYGPFQPVRQTTFFTMVRTGRFPVIGDGKQRRSMVYVDNLVQGVVAAELTPTAPGQAWWIADARPYPIDEIVATVGDALRDEGYHVALNRLRLPAFAGRLAQRADAVLQRRGRYVPQLHVLGELGATIACDISAATAELGYVPTVDLADGMRRSIRWCKQQGLEL